MRHSLFVALLLAALLSSCGGGKDSEVVLVLEVDTSAGPASQEDLDRTIDILERRLDALDIDGGAARLAGPNEIEILASGGVDVAGLDALTGGGRLMFCEPVVNDAGQIAITRDGTVAYEPASCISAHDDADYPIVEGGELEFADWDPSIQTFSLDDVIWQPAMGELKNGAVVPLTEQYITETSAERRQPDGELIDPLFEGEDLEQTFLVFTLNADGAELMGQITDRLGVRNYPITFFLDGAPLLGEDGRSIAPAVQAKITRTGIISGLSEADAQLLSAVLNSGPLPLAVRIVTQ